MLVESLDYSRVKKLGGGGLLQPERLVDFSRHCQNFTILEILDL